jgi:nucleoside-diphosphate-sugar epimerase
VTGPIHKQRWIYSASKQLLDRVIYAHGIRDGLDYTLFRPFNWIGPLQDTLDLESGGCGRVVVQFLGCILRGLPLPLVDGGLQRRCFTDIADGTSALLALIDNPQGRASGKIFNIGNPTNDASIGTLAHMLLDTVRTHPLCPPQAHQARLQEIPSASHYGTAYQDVAMRVPKIEALQQATGWQPRVDLATSLREIVAYHLTRLYS